MAGRATNEPTNYIAVGLQSDKDVEAEDFYFVKHLDGSGFEIEEEVNSEREGGDGQEVGIRYKTAISADGQLAANARPGLTGRIGAWTLGADSPSILATPASLTLHRLTPAPTLPYLTIEQFWADELERNTNCQFTGFELEAEAGGLWKFNANFLSGGSVYRKDSASALTPARETHRPYFFPGGTYVIEGIASTKVTKVKIGAQRNVDGDIRTTGLNREDVVPLNQDYDIDFTLKYENATLYRKIKYSGGSQVSVPFLATGAFHMALANGSYPFELHMPCFDYVDAKVNKLDPDGKTMYIDVSAMTEKSGTWPLWMDVVTDDADAYIPTGA